MQTFDFSPLYRTLVGFDRVADMIDQAARTESGAQGYPPYNIEQVGEDRYGIELAVAGFTQDELSVEVREGVLYISGRKVLDEEAQDRNFLHRGIAERAFERRFQLADHVFVTGARLEHGVLRVELHRELPEAMKPRTIAIESGDKKARKLMAKRKKEVEVA